MPAVRRPAHSDAKMDPSDDPTRSAAPAPPPDPAGRQPGGVEGRRWNRQLLRGTAAALVVALVFAGGVGFDRTGVLGGPAAEPPPPDAAQFDLIRQAWDLLRTEYVGARDLDPTKLAYGAIDGLTQAVGDTGHTTFLTPTERKDAAAALSGTYVGIGVELDTKDGQAVVVGVIRGGPGEAAGIRAGDHIVAVDGKSSGGADLDAVAGSIRGSAGTVVTLTLARDGVKTPITVRVVRAEVHLPAVESATVPGTTLAILRVEQFSTGASDAFASQLQSLLAGHPTGLVLDLRGDPGGYVNEAVGIASQFLASGDVYRARDASGKETPVAVRPPHLAPTIPLVVLVDNGTASSAEIVAGALQDAGRAKIVGATTFGTGTVLAEFPLTDGSALRIGTEEWLTPKGQPIWHHGIAPDVTVALPAGVLPDVPDDLARLGASGVRQTKDAQLAKAIELLRPAS